MESITIKVEDDFAKEINTAMHPYYSTKTEFIRDAIRDKIKFIKKESAMMELARYFGKAKTKTSYFEERKIRKKVGRKIAKRFGVSKAEV